MNKITSFQGKYRFLSNFEGNIPNGKTVEHHYQAAKTTIPYFQNQIMQCSTPGQAKRIGRKVPIRSDWENIKIDIMRNLVEQKFSVQPYKSLLLSTKDFYLEEGNTWGDTFWGICNGIGQNWLGKILMETREKLGKE